MCQYSPVTGWLRFVSPSCQSSPSGRASRHLCTQTQLCIRPGSDLSTGGTECLSLLSRIMLPFCPGIANILAGSDYQELSFIPLEPPHQLPCTHIGDGGLLTCRNLLSLPASQTDRAIRWTPPPFCPISSELSRRDLWVVFLVILPHRDTTYWMHCHHYHHYIISCILEVHWRLTASHSYETYETTCMEIFLFAK